MSLIQTSIASSCLMILLVNGLFIFGSGWGLTLTVFKSILKERWSSSLSQSSTSQPTLLLVKPCSPSILHEVSAEQMERHLSADGQTSTLLLRRPNRWVPLHIKRQLMIILGTGITRRSLDLVSTTSWLLEYFLISSSRCKPSTETEKCSTLVCTDCDGPLWVYWITTHCISD